MNPSRLKWACRRGMLELDLMLLPFAEAVYPSLNEQDQHAFDALLSCGDQDLFDWLMGKKEADEQHVMMVKRVVDYAQQTQ